MTDKRAQSDAPSAEAWWARTYKCNEEFFAYQLDDSQRELIFQFAEAYAALRTAKWENLAKDLGWSADAEFFRTNIAAFHGQIGAYMDLEKQVAQLERELAEVKQWNERLAKWIDISGDKVEAAESALSKARNTNRELNRLNQELKAAWNADTDRKQWFRYYKAAVSLFGDMATRAETAETALSEARERAQNLEVALSEMMTKWEMHSGLCCTSDADKKVVVTKESCKCPPEAKRWRKLLTSSASGAAGKGGADAGIKGNR